jgi:hypothetical protein
MNRRSDHDRRSGIDTRPAEEKAAQGERRSGKDRRSGRDRRSHRRLPIEALLVETQPLTDEPRPEPQQGGAACGERGATFIVSSP